MKLARIIVFYLSALLPSVQLVGQVKAPVAYSSANNVNYLRTWDARAPQTDASKVVATTSIDSFLMSTVYLDGLGRPMQTVAKELSPLGKDLVTPVVYDVFGREERKYLPFAANNTGSNASITDGLFKLNPFQQDSVFYSSANAVSPVVGQGETWIYARTKFESSPLNRVDSLFEPGNNWVGGNRAVVHKYLVNMASDSVRIWTVTSAVSQAPTTNATYPAGELYKSVVVDEHGSQVVEYKDKEGQTVLEKVQLSASPGTAHVGWLCTYYVYDDMGNLRFVLQPKTIETLLLAGSWTMSTTVRDELCFYYGYDGLNRMIIKKMPGSGEVWMVYDTWDRVVLTQDANLHADDAWLFTKYDWQNRPIMTGFYTNSTYITQSTMQAYVTAQDMAHHENYQTATFPLYSLDQSFPSVTYGDVLTITYYDDYSWTGWYGPISAKDNTWDSEFSTTSTNARPFPQPLTQNSQTKGLVTGAWDKAGDGILTTTYYDENARVIQTRAYNHTGGTDFMTTQYSFSGQILHSVLRHEKGGTNTQTHLVQTRTSYDHAGRLEGIEKKLNSTVGSTALSKNWHPIVSIEYDEIAQPKTKTLAPDYGTSGLDALVSTYNIRGWLTAINKEYIDGTSEAWFGMELGYDKDGYATFANKQYNGNVSGTIWRSKGDGERRKYDFSYDAANRLLKADFTQKAGSNWNVTAGIDYSMMLGDGTDASLAYDANGNIKQMWQRGWKLGGSVTIDSLIYETNDYSNKLKYVRDGNNNPNTTLGDFKEPSQNNTDNQGGTADYNFDDNGNIIADANKSVATISYNHLNLPTYINVSSKGYIDYVYDNAGNKLKKVVNETGKPPKTTLYIAGFVYENDTLQLLQHEMGRIRLTIDTTHTYTGYAFDYFEKDHLGNVRVVLTEQRDTAAYCEASMETAKLGRDTLYYSHVSETRAQRSSVSGYPETDDYTDPNDWVAETRGDGNKIGPGILLKVMAGDKLNVRVSSWYKAIDDDLDEPANPLTDLVAALIASIGGMDKFGVTELQNSTVLGPNISEFLGNRTYDPERPKAYVNWILFDEQLKYVEGSSGFDQVPDVEEYNNDDPPNAEVYTHLLNNLTMGKSGYLYIYVSNETPNISVFFDNLQVTHFKGPLVEEEHYYPFGLTMAGISSRALGKQENQFKYNGIELVTDLDLSYYDALYRELDPQLGRWWQIDPKVDSFYNWSPYNSNYDNPIRFADPLGDNPILRALARQGIKWVAKTLKGAYKPVTTEHAGKILKQGGSVTSIQKGSAKNAKTLMKSNADGKPVARHDGHTLPDGKTGKPHYQKKSGDGSHVFYSVIPVGAAGAGEANSTNATQGKTTGIPKIPKLTTMNIEAIIGDATGLNKAGRKIFGDNGFGRFVDDWINPF